MANSESASLGTLQSLGREGRFLTSPEFQKLSGLPPEQEWFSNLNNARTRQAYQNDLRDFSSFVGMEDISEFREIKRSHIIAWRNNLKDRGLSPASIRRRMSSLASLFDLGMSRCIHKL